ncbi:TOG array regulator of axonemal microtubules protein 1-like [Centropristis striata]|uniref:TOG array regulator of axonemal microtubules protein 1-like n=1 Tax=Centropristis striata TaxID=184440 RepID=UPI0027DFE007|nr:TOG array regulator of axonemal microtubules protein 1-like [Centropristis striata]
MEKIRLMQHPSPKPPAAPRRTPAVAQKVHAPSSALPKRQEYHQETPVRPKVPAPPSKPAPLNKKGPRRGTNLRTKKPVVDDIRPLANPSEGLSICFKQLESEDWEEKMKGLKTVRALARHHSALLQTKLHEICLVLEEQVNNLRSAVAVAAMDAVGELHVQLGKAMDPHAERTGRALLLKLATTTNTFIHQQANLALDSLVEGCSPGRIITFLVNAGLNHRCAAVRASTAQHLHQLADIMGVDQTLTAGKVFAKRYLTAVSKMAVDAAPDVRHHGQAMLQGLVHQKDFIALYDKVVPTADRRPLQKILQKMRQ